MKTEQPKLIKVYCSHRDTPLAAAAKKLVCKIEYAYSWLDPIAPGIDDYSLNIPLCAIFRPPTLKKREYTKQSARKLAQTQRAKTRTANTFYLPGGSYSVIAKCPYCQKIALIIFRSPLDGDEIVTADHFVDKLHKRNSKKCDLQDLIDWQTKHIGKPYTDIYNSMLG